MCTTIRTKAVIVGLALVAVTVGYVSGFTHWRYSHVVMIGVFFVVVPVLVLIINVLLVREVRRASINAAANLGLHHQSTSSNSAVPTVMVIVTSLVYLLLLAPVAILELPHLFGYYIVFLTYCTPLVWALSNLVYAYNFYVYLITGKQFRSDLRTLFSRCSTCSCSSSSCFCSSSCSCACNCTCACTCTCTCACTCSCSCICSCTESFLLSISNFVFGFFISHVCLVPCGRLSWLFVSFWMHANIVYRIASYRTCTCTCTCSCSSCSSCSSFPAVVVYDRNDARIAGHGHAESAV